ncbi:hypothetical protein BD626DRAFT_491020 [Schizophyllum amplum]|uniref:ABM domain-containing protein n=1 Tax=Schizophyllum amplum TaxID=97359 RepID=A0A550CK07_9AGAR|nr:hypothetical protein BD626DRAFT_491020 [Auriculariopsis ampla]
MSTSLLDITIVSNFDAAEALRAKDAASDALGLQSVYIGQEVEDPSQGYCVLQWGSLSARDAFLRSAAYETYARHLTVAHGPFVAYLSEANSAAYATILAAPVQKIGFLVARTDLGRERVRGIMDFARAGREERAEKHEIMGEIITAAVDDEDCSVVLDGWESVEKHRAYAARGVNTSAMSEVIHTLDWFSSRHVLSCAESMP